MQHHIPHKKWLDWLIIHLRMGVEHVYVSNVLRQSLVVRPRRLIENQKEKVKTREERSWKIDVLDRRDFGVISTIKRIGCSQDGRACVQSSGDTCFRDGDCLLLHDLMDRGSVSLLHLVELVYTADTVICENKCASL